MLVVCTGTKPNAQILKGGTHLKLDLNHNIVNLRFGKRKVVWNVLVYDDSGDDEPRIGARYADPWKAATYAFVHGCCGVEMQLVTVDTLTDD